MRPRPVLHETEIETDYYETETETKNVVSKPCLSRDLNIPGNHSSLLTIKDVGGRCPLPPEICAQSDPPPLKNADLDQYLLITSQP